MKILQINYSDNKGGAAKAAFRLNQSLNDNGISSKLLVLDKNINNDFIIPYETSNSIYSRAIKNYRKLKVDHKLKKISNHDICNYEIFTTHHSIYKELVNYVDNYDLVNLHWVSGFLDFNSFFLNFPKNIPIVWTLHDMNPFTGGCHYDNGCERFQTRCGKCPQLNSEIANDITRNAIVSKNKTLNDMRNKKLNFVSPSKWLKSKLDNSYLFSGCNSTVIPNSIDTNSFQPRDKVTARRILELPIYKKIILIGSYSLKTERKGYSIAKEALKNINDDDLFVASFGSGKLDIENKNYKHLGFITDDILLSILYSAADLFLITSIQDNLPNTVIESISCGTPVVSFEVGGIPEIITNDFNGMILKGRSVVDLKKSLRLLLNNEKKLAQMSINARKSAIDKYDLKIQSGRYKKFYENLIFN